MVTHPEHGKELLESSCNQVLIKIANNNNMLAGMFFKYVIQVVFQEVKGFTSLPLWSVANTEQYRLMFASPHLEEHELKVVRMVDVEGLQCETFAEANSNATKSATYPVPTVPLSVASDLSIVLGYRVIQKGFDCGDDIYYIGNNKAVSEVTNICLKTPDISREDS